MSETLITWLGVPLPTGYMLRDGFLYYRDTEGVTSCISRRPVVVSKLTRSEVDPDWTITIVFPDSFDRPRKVRAKMSTLYTSPLSVVEQLRAAGCDLITEQATQMSRFLQSFRPLGREVVDGGDCFEILSFFLPGGARPIFDDESEAEEIARDYDYYY